MRRVSGVLGFRGQPTEIEPGVFQDVVATHSFIGEVYSSPPSTYGTGEHAQGDFIVHQSISTIVPKSVSDNAHNVIFVEFKGVQWVVQNCTIEHPRVIFKLGGVYNAR